MFLMQYGSNINEIVVLGLGLLLLEDGAFPINLYKRLLASTKDLFIEGVLIIIILFSGCSS